MTVHLAELDRLTDFAKAVTASLAETWTSVAGATVRIGSPQAEELRAQELAGTLEGWSWVLPVEVTGVCGGALAILLDLSLVSGPEGEDAASGGTAARLAGAMNEFLAGAADRLTAAMGGPVSLDRMGLREVPGEQAAVILGEFLGQGDLVAVSFAAEIAATPPGGGSGEAGEARKGEVAVIFGTVLAREVGGARIPAGKTLILRPPAELRELPRKVSAPEEKPHPSAPAPVAPAPVAPAPVAPAPAAPAPAAPPAKAPEGTGPLRRAKARAAKGPPGAPGARRVRPPGRGGLPADGMALLERVRGLRLRLSADVASLTLTVGDLLGVRPGSVIDLGKAVTEPLELRAGGRPIALGDAVSLPEGSPGQGSPPAAGSPRGGFGLKVRGA